MTPNTAKEEQIVHLVRNALLVAGQEMGEGDHWPVVKDTVYKIMKDWEDLKVERNVDEELKIQTYEQLRGIDEDLAKCSPEIRAKVDPIINELREVCEAHFSDLNPRAVMYQEDDAPDHIKRMNAILSTMEHKDE